MGFWGVILESGKRYSQTVDESYHLTMASLEPPSGDGKKPSKYVSVMVEHQNTEFMICTLEPERNLQIPLDHMFVAGEEVTFFLNGEGTVHLTGYLVPDDYDDFDEDLDDEEEDEEASDADEDSDSVKMVSTKRKNEALESSPEALGKKAKVDSKLAKVDSKLAKDSPNKTSKVEEKDSINAFKNKNLNENKVSKIVPQNNKKESDDSEDEDDSDEDEEESDQDMDESLGLIDKEAVEAEDSDDEEDEEESSDESDDESPQQKSSPFKGKPNKQNEQKQNKNKNQQNQQQTKSPQNQQQNKSPQNQQQNKSPQNQQQNRQKQFGSGQKGGFQGNQQKGQFQKGQWNQSGQKNQFGDNQNQKGGWQQKKQFGGQNQGRNQQFGQQRGQQQNSPNFKGKQNPNFKGQQKGNFGTPNTPNFNQNKGETKEQKTNANQRKLEKGLIIEDVRVGNGPEAKKGKFIHVNYIGRLSDNKEFDRSGNKPFSFKLGKGEVIKGWDIALEGMKVGGKRKVIVPPNMGYGNRPVGEIPANSALHFEVELKSVT